MRVARKILLPVDYSERCFDIARQAVEIGRRFGSEITTLQVRPSSLAAGSAAKLAQFASRELKDVHTRCVIRCGEPAAEILRQAEDDKTDLITMPTRGFSSFRRLLLGSVTASVLHRATCPVWTGPHVESVAASIPPRHIVCAVAFGSGESQGMEWACALAQAYPAELTVIHVAPRSAIPEEVSLPRWKSHALPNDSSVAARQMVVETADASKTIPALARHLCADLLILDLGTSRSEQYEIILASPAATLLV